MRPLVHQRVELMEPEGRHLDKRCVDVFEVAMCETLWTRFFEKKMESNNNKQWVSLIPEVLDTYMNTKHTSIKMTPNEAEESKNQRKLHIIHNRKYKIAESKRQHPKFKEGDTVRLKKDTSVFKRSWHKKWSDTIFTIGKVLTRQVVPRYVLIDPRDNKAMSGHPVEADLLRVRV